MGRIKRFEEIRSWQLARVLCREVYDVTKRAEFARDWGLRDQIRRAALSIMLNIAERFARRSRKEFCQFLYIAHGSAAEVQAALYVAKDQNYLDDDDFTRLYEQTDEVSRTIAGFIRYLNT